MSASTATLAADVRSRALSLPRQIPAWFGALMVAALWFAARPYRGVRHDGILYMGQALRHLWPERLSQDLFFAYGSQDRFSFFSNGLAWLYRMVGVGTAEMLLLVPLQLLLLASIAALLRDLRPRVGFWLALASVALFPHLYGGTAVLGFGEPFLTARTAAEPLALLGLAELLRRRLAWSLIGLVGACVMHPLIGLPALVVAWAYLCMLDRRWAWAALLALLPVALALGGMAPFTGLFQRFDVSWWDRVAIANANVFITNWQAIDWQLVVFDLAMIAAASPMMPAALARLFRATLAASILLMAVSFIGVDLAHDVLLTSLQFWRVLWLVHLLALAAFPLIALELWRRGTNGPLATFALAAAAVAVGFSWAAGWAFVAWAGAAAWLAYRGTPLSAQVRWLATAGTAAALVGMSAFVGWSTFQTVKEAGDRIAGVTPLSMAFASPALTMLAGAAVLWAWRRGEHWAKASLALVFAMAVFALSHWDQRPPWARYLEGSLAQEHPFKRLVPPQAQVYWHQDLMATWLLLERASFFSYDQSAGLLFNRGTAIEFARRIPPFAALRLQAEVCQLMAGLSADGKVEDGCTPTQELVDDICKLSSGPDFLVFDKRLPRGVVADWRFEGDVSRPKTYYLYDCSKLR